MSPLADHLDNDAGIISCSPDSKWLPLQNSVQFEPISKPHIAKLGIDFERFLATWSWRRVIYSVRVSVKTVHGFRYQGDA
jgi:hypothetical protein